MVRVLVAYQTRPWALAVFGALAVVSGGLAWVLGKIFPQLTLWTMRLCPAEEAEFVLVKVRYRQ